MAKKVTKAWVAVLKLGIIRMKMSKVEKKT